MKILLQVLPDMKYGPSVMCFVNPLVLEVNTLYGVQMCTSDSGLCFLWLFTVVLAGLGLPTILEKGQFLTKRSLKSQ
jgi:hypothetical protein